MTKLYSPFSLFDVPLIRASKNSYCELEKVTDNSIYFIIDDVSVRIEKINGYLKLSCSCEFCGKKGIASNTLCRRSIRAIWELIKMNGRVSEIYVKPTEDENGIRE